MGTTVTITQRLDDYRDLALADAAWDAVLLTERIAELEADVRVYRALTVAAFDALHDLTRDQDRARAQHQQVKDEYRAAREQILLQAGADDPGGTR